MSGSEQRLRLKQKKKSLTAARAQPRRPLCELPQQATEPSSASREAKDLALLLDGACSSCYYAWTFEDLAHYGELLKLGIEITESTLWDIGRRC